MIYLLSRKGMARLSVVLAGIYLIGLVLYANLIRYADIDKVTIAGVVGVPAILIVINLIPWVVSGFRD